MMRFSFRRTMVVRGNRDMRVTRLTRFSLRRIMTRGNRDTRVMSILGFSLRGIVVTRGNRSTRADARATRIMRLASRFSRVVQGSVPMTTRNIVRKAGVRKMFIVRIVHRQISRGSRRAWKIVVSRLVVRRGSVERPGDSRGRRHSKKTRDEMDQERDGFSKRAKDGWTKRRVGREKKRETD